MRDLDLQPLNRQYNAFKPSASVSASLASHLNDVQRDVTGISAIAQVLRASTIEAEREGGAALSSFTEDGLLQAIIALSCLVESDLCELSDWNDQHGGQRA
ncbi:hypothetical protein [Pandoraea soli]